MTDAPVSAPRALAPFSSIGADHPFAAGPDRFAAHVGPSLIGPGATVHADRAGGVEDAARFTGYIDVMPALYVAIDVLAAPSRGEGFGLMLVEAMAAGRPRARTRVLLGPLGRALAGIYDDVLATR